MNLYKVECIDSDNELKHNIEFNKGDFEEELMHVSTNSQNCSHKNNHS